jgi:hypothetical protein
MPVSVEFQDARAKPDNGSATKHDQSPGAVTADQQKIRAEEIAGC